MPARFEEPRDQQPANRIVVGDQNSQAGRFSQHRCFRHLHRGRSGVHWLEPRSEVKAASGSDLALHPDPAAQQPGQPVADCQAETGAAKASRDGTIRLLKGLENSSLLLFGNTDTGVRYGEMKLHRFRGALSNGHREGNTAPLRELHRVPRQIDENLA